MRRTRLFAILLTAGLFLLGAAAAAETAAAAAADRIRNGRSDFPYQELPGVSIYGYVRLEDGTGVPGVAIYQALAVYWPGALEDITGQDGYYQSRFGVIPGDEMVTVHAEHACYTFLPVRETWRHYYGHEEREIHFTAYPAACRRYYLPALQK